MLYIALILLVGEKISIFYWRIISVSNDVSYRRSDNYIYPHSPDVLERKTTDNGFSEGWVDGGKQFNPHPASRRYGLVPQETKYSEHKKI